MYGLELPALNEVRVVCSGAGRPSPQGGKIDRIEPEPGIKPLEPFIVVDQGPVKVSPDIHTLFNALVDNIDMFLHEPDLLLAVFCGNPVFGDDERDIQP